MKWEAGLKRTRNVLGVGVGANWDFIGRRGLERTGNVLGGGGWSELVMNWEAGVGANWECIGRRGLRRTGNVLGGGVGANW